MIGIRVTLLVAVLSIFENRGFKVELDFRVAWNKFKEERKQIENQHLLHLDISQIIKKSW